MYLYHSLKNIIFNIMFMVNEDKRYTAIFALHITSNLKLSTRKLIFACDCAYNYCLKNKFVSKELCLSCWFLPLNLIIFLFYSRRRSIKKPLAQGF